MKKTSLFVAFASMFMLASCGEDFVVPDEPVSVTSVSCNPSSVELTVGEGSKDVRYNVFGTGEFTRDVILTSANEGIATAKLAEDGSKQFSISPVSEGDTVINVKSVADESKATSVSVHVNPEKIIEVTPKIHSINADTQGFELALASAPYTVKVTVKGTENIDKSFTIVADNENVVLSKNEVSQPADYVSDTLEGEFTVSASVVGTSTIQVTSVADKTYTIAIPVRVTSGGALPEEGSVTFNTISKTIAPDEAFDIIVTSTGDVTYSTDPEDASGIFTYQVKEGYVHVLGVGEGEATLYAFAGNDSAACKITVKAVPTDVRSLYFSNNGALGYEEMYLFAWNDYDDKIAEWPGVKLEDVYKNDQNENCYRYTIDILKYPHFILNNGKAGEELKQTPDSDFPTGEYDNIWFGLESDTLVCHTATFIPYGPSVRFESSTLDMYEGRTVSIPVTSMLGDVIYSITEGIEYIEIGEYDNSHVSVTGLVEGTAVLKATIPAHDSYEEVSATITITVKDSSLIKTYYFTNNQSWDNVYFYGWGEHAPAMEYPGTKLTNKVKNSLGQDCYTVDINPSDYDGFLFTDYQYVQTVDITVSDLGEKNNIYPSEWNYELEKWNVDFAIYEPFTYEVEFNQATGTVYNNKALTLSVTANADATFAVVSGGEYVEILSSTASSVKLGYLAAGTATIKATCGDATATIEVSVVNEAAPQVDKTIYFSNSFGWDSVYVYAFGDEGSKNAEWPGVNVAKCGTNKEGQDLYSFTLDENEYEAFVVNNGNGAQTVNISFEELGADDNVWPKEDVDAENHNLFGHTTLTHRVELSKDNVSLYEGESKDITVSTTDNNLLAYEYVTGSADIVKLDKYNGGFKLTYVGEGTASIKVSCGAVEKTISVTCTAGEKPSNIKTYYVTNNWKWEDLRVYMYGDDSVSKTAWPGDSLTEIGANGDGDKVYKFEIDTNSYHTFIINGNDVAGKGGAQRQTVDILVDSFTFGNNAIYFDKWEDDSQMKVVVGYWTLTPSVEFAHEEISVQVGKEITETLTMNYDFNVVYSTNRYDIADIVAGTHSQVTISGVAEGDAEIKAYFTVDGVEYSDTVTVHVTADEPVHVHSYNATTHYCSCGELDPDYVIITFKVDYNTFEDGDLYFTSSVTSWAQDEKSRMTWTDGNIWTFDLIIKPGTSFEYKMSRTHNSASTEWQSGSNRSYTVGNSSKTETISW